MGTWNFGYDTLNRLVTATSGSNAPAPYASNYGCWSYDAFGNRTAQSMSTTACGDNPPLTSWAQYNGTVNGSGNNQMSATSQNSNQANGYDAAGDVTNDGVNQYLYDAEGRICAVASTPIPGITTLTGYLYDADGTRVAKGTIANMSSCDPSLNGFQTTTDYVLGPGGEQVSEMGVGDAGGGSSSGTALAWQHTNVWAAGKLLATYDNAGLHFYLDDPLGTRRAQTDSSGVLEQTCVSLPFGDGLNCTGGDLSAPPEHHFTGKERDVESGNDYMFARYYNSATGRFLSPDWSAKEDPVPYATMSDPQSLNLYSYVRNHPLNMADPDGHCCWDDMVQWVDNHPRTMQVAKGVGQIGLGVAAVAVSATAEVGSGGLATAGVIFGVQGGVAAAVTGVTNIMGAATKTDVSGATKALEAVSNPAGQIVTAATGSLDKGATAAVAGDVLVGGANLKSDVKEITNMLKDGEDLKAGGKAVGIGQTVVNGAQAASEAVHEKKEKKDENQ